MDAKQRIIMENERELQRLRIELGIKPTMTVLFRSVNPTKSTFNLRDMNKELINNKQ